MSTLCSVSFDTEINQEVLICSFSTISGKDPAFDTEPMLPKLNNLISHVMDCKKKWTPMQSQVCKGWINLLNSISSQHRYPGPASQTILPHLAQTKEVNLTWFKNLAKDIHTSNQGYERYGGKFPFCYSKLSCMNLPCLLLLQFSLIYHDPILYLSDDCIILMLTH